MPVANQAHHVLPQKFNDRFITAGINIHDPKYGMWIPTDQHLKGSSQYNELWKGFFKDNNNPTQDSIFNAANRFNTEVFGVAPNF